MNHLRILICIFLAILLTACAIQPPGTAEPGDAPGGMFAASPIGSDEWAAAPYWTRHIMLLKRTKRDLQAGKITAAQAKEVLRLSDEARALLDSAAVKGAAGDKVGALQDRTQAGFLMDQETAILLRIKP